MGVQGCSRPDLAPDLKYFAAFFVELAELECWLYTHTNHLYVSRHTYAYISTYTLTQYSCNSQNRTLMHMTHISMFESGVIQGYEFVYESVYV